MDVLYLMKLKWFDEFDGFDGIDGIDEFDEIGEFDEIDEFDGCNGLYVPPVGLLCRAERISAICIDLTLVRCNDVILTVCHLVSTVSWRHYFKH